MGIDVQPWRTCLTGEEKDQHSLDMNGYDRYLEVSQKIAILTYLNTSSRMLTNLEVSQGLGENGENGETSNPGDFLWMTMTYHDIPWLLKQADWGSSDWPGVTSARGPPWRLCRCFLRCPPDPFDAESGSSPNTWVPQNHKNHYKLDGYAENNPTKPKWFNAKMI